MLAVLRVRFDSNADPTTVWTDALFHGWLDPSVPFSLAHYWTAASQGAFDLRYVLFPPLLAGDPRVGLPAGSPNSVVRPRLIDGVLGQAQFEFGFDVTPFEHILLWFAQPTDVFGMGSYMVTGTSLWPKSVGVAVVDAGTSFDSVCHEVGHAFGFDHPIATNLPGPYTQQNLDYGSPYDIMAAQTYQGFASAFVRAQDVRLPDGPAAAGATPPQRVVGPLLSGAQLAARKSWLPFPPFVRRVAPGGGSAGTPVRLQALDRAAGAPGTWPQDPCVVLVDTVVGQTYSMELRRGRGYDAAVGMAVPNAPPAGLVVHHRHETGRIFYDGVFPLPRADGDLDWRSWSGRFSIRVGEVADDLSWASITIGGADFWRHWDADLDIVSDSQQEEVVERRRVDIDIPCVRGNYAVEKIERRYETVLMATAVGFERPGYGWTVNGEAVRPSAGASWDAVTFTTQVTIPDPEPAAGGGRTRLGTVRLRYRLVGNRLTLRSGVQPANFAVDVRVAVSETDPGVVKALIPTVTGSQLLDYRCLRYAWEDAYDEAFRRCFDFGTRWREVEDLRVVIDPGDPPPYAVRPDELEEVLGLELLAAARQEAERDEVVRYMASRYLIPEELIQARLDRRR